jgi:hypothetical protein
MMGEKVYTRDDYDPFIGKSGSPNRDLKALPNVRDVDPIAFLNDLAARGHMMEPVWGYALLPDGSRPQWTQFFLLADANMGFQLGGGGYAVTYANPFPFIRRFQICNHEIVLHAGADPSRGWNPGHCKHCGMDMSVDSSD